MKSIRLLTMAAVLGFAIGAQAVAINGGITVTGGWGIDTPDINDATALTGGPGVIAHLPPSIIGVAGDFDVPGIFVNAPGSILSQSWVFGGLTPDTLPVVLWQTATDNAFANQLAASFTLTQLTYINQGIDGQLIMQGKGLLSLEGYDDTVADWDFNGTENQGTFSFTSSQGTVPDGGTTAMLIGSALTGLAFLRRKLA